MSEQTDNLIFLLKPYGLDQEESIVYLNLLENNTSSALTISRNTHLSRTKVYRILDKLIQKQLASQEYNQNGFKFQANHPSQLEFLINQKETEVSTLKQSLSQTVNLLETHLNLNHPSSQVLYYQGSRGLSQVNWNLLNTKKEFLSYEVDTADAYLPHSEAEKLRQALIDKNITSRTLMNKKISDNFSQVPKIKIFQEIRFVPSKILTIKSDIFIYNDIFTVCHYLDNHDVFCLEIKNQFLIDMQKQIFENLWNQTEQSI